MSEQDSQKPEPGQAVYATVIRPLANGYCLLLDGHLGIAHLTSERQFKAGDSFMVEIVSVAGRSIAVKENARMLRYRPRPHRFSIRRAIDLMPPPLPSLKDRQDPIKFSIGEYKPEWLISDIERGDKTGCLIATSESRLSRAAVLLLRGRGVGAIYGCVNRPHTGSTEDSIEALVNDLYANDTVVTLWDLPAELVFSLSALFLGRPVERDHELDAVTYFAKVKSSLREKKSTATLAFSLTNEVGAILVFFHQGDFIGAFWVEAQIVEKNDDFVMEMLRADPGRELELSVLPDETARDGMGFGFRLSHFVKMRGGGVSRRSGSN